MSPEKANIFLLLIIIIVGILFYFIFPTIVKKSKEIEIKKNTRRCINCGYIGITKTYFDNARHLFNLLTLYLCGLLPGIVYQLYGKGKRICPNCKSTNLALK